MSAWQLRTQHVGQKPKLLHFHDQAEAVAEYHALVCHLLRHHPHGVWTVELDPPEGDGRSFTHHACYRQPDVTGTYQV